MASQYETFVLLVCMQSLGGSLIVLRRVAVGICGEVTRATAFGYLVPLLLLWTVWEMARILFGCLGSSSRTAAERCAASEFRSVPVLILCVVSRSPKQAADPDAKVSSGGMASRRESKSVFGLCVEGFSRGIYGIHAKIHVYIYISIYR